ncbi:MAG: MarR family transcriptional regulator [Gammaproteobacteria bacterium]|nr:MarR family transcriptional regulator [Gammaproteobacteria bacterium]
MTTTTNINDHHTQQETIATPLPYSKRMVFALRKIMQQVDHHSRKLDKQQGITVPQLVCLYEIYEKGVMTLSVLSKHVHLACSTLVGIIDRLEEKGLLMRTRNTEDRRVIFIEITDKGRQFVSTSPHLLHHILDEKFKVIPEADQILIANSLDLLVEMLV